MSCSFYLQWQRKNIDKTNFQSISTRIIVHHCFQFSSEFCAFNMSLVKIPSIFDAIKPLHFYSQLFGLTAFSIRRNITWHHETFVSFCNYFCILLTTSWHGYSIVNSVFLEHLWKVSDRTYMSEFFENCLKILIVGNCTIIIYILWWLFAMQSIILKALSLFNDVDEALCDMNAGVNHKKHHRTTLTFVVFIFILNVFKTGTEALSSYLLNAYETTFMASIGEFIGFAYVFLLSGQTVFIMLSVQIRYQKINKILIAKYKETILNFQRPSKHHDKVFQKLPVLYCKMADVCEILSYCYGIPVEVSDCWWTFFRLFSFYFLRLCFSLAIASCSWFSQFTLLSTTWRTGKELTMRSLQPSNFFRVL